MTPFQVVGLVLILSAGLGFFLASAVLPGTAPTRLGSLCFWLARLLFAASVATAALGVLAVATYQCVDAGEYVGLARAACARSFTDVLDSAFLAGWAVVVQVVGMSSFAWRQYEEAGADEPGESPEDG